MDIPRELEKKECRFCGGFTWRRREKGSWAYCMVWKKWAEDHPGKPSAALRTCKRFFIKGKNQGERDEAHVREGLHE